MDALSPDRAGNADECTEEVSVAASVPTSPIALGDVPVAIKDSTAKASVSSSSRGHRKSAPPLYYESEGPGWHAEGCT